MNDNSTGWGVKGKRVCFRGHPYSKRTAYIRPNGSINCRVCRSQNQKEYNERKREQAQAAENKALSK